MQNLPAIQLPVSATFQSDQLLFFQEYNRLHCLFALLSYISGYGISSILFNFSHTLQM